MAKEQKQQKSASPSSTNVIRRLIPVAQPANPKDGIEHRGFPRRTLELRVKLRRGEADEPSFAATLPSDNVSMSGMFLHSTFFLPVGTTFELSFSLPSEERPVTVRAELVRHQSDPVPGLGVRFEEFHGQSEIAMARLFLDAKMQEFSGRYLSSARAKTLDSEHERLVDALAAWELEKVTSGVDPWAP